MIKDIFSKFNIHPKFLPNYSKPFSDADKIEVVESTPIDYSTEAELLSLLKEGSKTLEYFLSIIDKVKHGDAPLIGQGAYKSVYGIDDKAVLVEKEKNTCFDFPTCLGAINSKQRVANNLAMLGINVPISYFSLFSLNPEYTTRLDEYHIDQQIPGKCLDYYSSKFAFKCFVQNSLGNPESSILNDQDNLNQACALYNLKLSQHRALTGQKFLPKFFSDFAKLSCLHLIPDCHGENIHYSSKNGYWFIDLDYGFAIRMIPENGLGQYLDSSLKKHVLDLGTNLLDDFVQDALGIDHNPNLHPNNHSYFSQFVYNGILLRQFENMLINNFPRELGNNLFQDLGFDGLERDFEALKCYHLQFIDYQTLCNLETALKLNDTSSLDNIKAQFALPDKFNFAKELNLDIFFEAMENTRTGKDSKVSPMTGETTTATINQANEVSFEME